MILSIVIPVYNLEGWLDACLESLAAQSDRTDRWEIVAVDDGSTDASPAALDAWARRLVGRLFVHHIPNGGVNPARQYGLAHARGDYVWFVDGDDVIHPRAVELYLSLFAKHPDVEMWLHRFAVGERIRFDDLPEEAPVTIHRADVRSVGLVCVWGGVFKADLIRGQSFPDFQVGEDLLFASAQLARAKAVAEVGCALYGYVMRPSSVSHVRTLRRQSEQIRFDLAMARFYAHEGARLCRDLARGRTVHLLFGVPAEIRAFESPAERRALRCQWREAVVAAHGLAPTRALGLVQRVEAGLMRAGFPARAFAFVNAMVFKAYVWGKRRGREK